MLRYAAHQGLTVSKRARVLHVSCVLLKNVLPGHKGGDVLADIGQLFCQWAMVKTQAYALGGQRLYETTSTRSVLVILKSSVFTMTLVTGKLDRPMKMLGQATLAECLLAGMLLAQGRQPDSKYW